MIIPGKVCPMPKSEGRHKLLPWADKEPPHRSGFACVLCSKTWKYAPGYDQQVLVETFPSS